MFDFSKPCRGVGDELVFELVPIVQAMHSGGQTGRNLWELKVISTDGVQKYPMCGWKKVVSHIDLLYSFKDIRWTHVDSLIPNKEKDVSNCVYFIEAVGCGRVKIGKADSLKRRQMGLGCSSPFPLNVLLTIPGAEEVEAELHKRFAHLRVHREWFLLQGELLDYIEENTKQ
jgi:hypothetical protein